MTAVLAALALAAAWLLSDIVLTIRDDRPVVGVRSHRPAKTRTQLATRPTTSRTLYLVARSECLLRRREPLLSAWPTPALTAGLPAIGQTIPAEFLPVRELVSVA